MLLLLLLSRLLLLVVTALCRQLQRLSCGCT
jgi:hypothetical protein